MAKPGKVVPDVVSLSLSSPPDDGHTNRVWNRFEKKVWTGSLFFGCAMLYSARTVMPLCVVKIAEELKWDKTQSGTVLSAFFWGYMMTQVLGGYLSDKLGGDIVICVAGIGWSLITFWTPRICYLFDEKGSAITVIVISRVLLGCCQGMHYPSVSSIVSKKISAGERTLAYSTITAGSHAGTLFCGSIGSLFMDKYGWQSSFYLVGFLDMLWLLYLRFVLIAKDRRKTQIISIKDNISQAVKIKTETSPELRSGNPVPYYTLFTKAGFWALIVGQVAKTNAHFILLSWLPTYFQETFIGAKGVNYWTCFYD